MKILIVDDNDDLREVFELLLSSFGHEALKAKSGVVALSQVTEFDPAVIFVDDQLVDIYGCELVRLFRGPPYLSNAYIVAFSGYSAELQRLERKDAGFDGFLGKPVLLEHLENLLKSVQAKFSSGDRVGTE